MKHLKTLEYVLSSSDTKHIKSDKDLSEEEVIDAKYLDVVAQFKIDNNVDNLNKMLTTLREKYPHYEGYARKIALAVWFDNFGKNK
jgi:hypothetical protein